MSNEAIAKGEAVLLKQARDKFVATFGRQPTAAACAPGRVNLIGEHIDYCEGFVLPVVSTYFTPSNCRQNWRGLGLVEKAKLCQKAEHEFPGMPCGIMDQYIVTMGKKDHALLIDCRSLESQQIPMQLDDLVVLVTNSNVKHQLTGKLKQQKCDEEVLKRAKHVIEEISRTEEVARVMKNKDFKRVGELFYQSHDSLSKLMEVSCPELDQIVDIIRGAPGVYGARMTGGGFGGCVVTLVKKSEVENLKKKILSEYKGTPTFFLSQPSDGVRLLKL
ncbi:hypothetical protein HF086_007843 [Spodoptera exigua]|uniref:Galactokinase n=1 Tax=Spodoptera exigua TaxID=7107 RepID=A0A922S9C6_SPOEX|nr:hypothetical protein HF086_007843 [Spodoptera exigua]